MAKRGETRPWQVRFEWIGSGITGADSFTSEDRALSKVRLLRQNAINREEVLVVEHGHRDSNHSTVVRFDGAALAAQDVDA